MVAPEEIRKQWLTLEKAHGKDMPEVARECAGKIERENSRDVTRKLLEAIKEHGLEKVQAAAKKTGKMAEDNPYRHVGYILYLLKAQSFDGRP